VKITTDFPKRITDVDRGVVLPSSYECFRMSEKERDGLSERDAHAVEGGEFV
jgi:hypothetical protein